MAFSASTHAIPSSGSGAVLIFSASSGDREVHLVNTGSSNVDIGGSSLTWGQGYALASHGAEAGALLSLKVSPGDEIWAVCSASGTSNVRVLVRSSECGC